MRLQSTGQEISALVFFVSWPRTHKDSETLQQQLRVAGYMGALLPALYTVIQSLPAS